MDSTTRNPLAAPLALALIVLAGCDQGNVGPRHGGGVMVPESAPTGPHDPNSGEPMQASSGADGGAWAGAPASGAEARRREQQQAPTADAQDFVDQAARADLFEIRCASTVIDADLPEGTTEVARRLRIDHQGADEKLRDIARDEGLRFPDDLTPAQELMVGKLQGEQGKALEETYLDQQEQGHEKAIELFAEAADALRDARLASFARDTLPTLRVHLQLIQARKDEIGD